MYLLVPLIVVIGIILVIFFINKFTSSSSVPSADISSQPYRKKDFLLTKAERSFYEVLSLAVKNLNVQLFVKVRLADLLYLPKGTDNRQKHINKITSKHVDFVICGLHNLDPVIAIELDDSSHQQANRVARDEFLEKALRDAGLPLLRVPAKESYNVQELASKINSILLAIKQAAVTTSK